MTKTMKPIELFATPTDGKQLRKYMKLFNTEGEQNAAVIGFIYYYDIMTLGWSEFKQFEDIEPGERIVSLTVAGMTWNLRAKQQLKQQLVLQEDADVLK